MHETVKALFTKMETAIESTPIPADRKQLILSASARLADLYTRFRETNDSRHGDQISKQVQFIVGELEACPEAHQLGLDVRKGLQHLHEELGIPALSLKGPKAPPKSPKRPKK